MRLRIRELLAARGMTAYRLAQASGGRIPITTAYRMVELNGKLPTFKASVLDALCEVLGVEPGELFERSPRRSRAGAPRREH